MLELGEEGLRLEELGGDAADDAVGLENDGEVLHTEDELRELLQVAHELVLDVAVHNPEDVVVEALEDSLEDGN